MSISKQSIVYFYWLFLFLLGAILVFIPIPEIVSKKIFGVYLVLGTLLSYIYNVPLFKRNSINVDKNEKYNDDAKYTDLIVLGFGIFLILS